MDCQKIRKKDRGIERQTDRQTERGREGEMNRWPYQSVLRLVFNLDAEREREAQRERELKRGRELHYISHSRNLTVEPPASPTVAHRCFTILDLVQRFPLGYYHTKELVF